jgi:hypothetical protein
MLDGVDPAIRVPNASQGFLGPNFEAETYANQA